MKKSAKVLLLSLCAVLLVAASVMGTLAYLTSTDEVKNTFTVGKVKITLDEAKVDQYGKEVDENGDPIKEGETAPRVKANEYKLIPGRTYVKDPTVHVDPSSEPCYIFVKVENGIEDLEPYKVNGNDYGDNNYIRDQMKDNGWTLIEWDEAEEWRGAVYYYNKSNDTRVTDGVYTPATGENANDLVVFSTFTIHQQVDKNRLEENKTNSITVTAYAIQADGFDSAADAWIDANPAASVV